MSSHLSPEDTVRALYGAFGAGDLEALGQVLADDVRWIYIGGAAPGRQARRGRREVLSFFADIYRQADIQDFSVHRVMPSDATVIVQGSETARLKHDGAIVTSDWVQIFDVEDGEVTTMTEYSVPVPARTEPRPDGT
ncbi:nuclear transport factor 2 family protein [Microtetraspora niveoalba]|uniref:nuclear transport factor 2 family protein n=1 Tax=Microtetraspora niveoalba TaxID=46175 RepID=UPI00082B7F4B|nr:nuclear transport factor 2 family protein [Microtetraspora niveoalba]